MARRCEVPGDDADSSRDAADANDTEADSILLTAVSTFCAEFGAREARVTT